MSIIEEILKERSIIIASIEAEWENARKRRDAVLKELREKYKPMRPYNSNWAYFTDYKFAHEEDGMKCLKIDPCPFCEGLKKVHQYNDNIVTKFRKSVDCPTCYGTGTAWFKYGVFEISSGRGTRGG